MENVESDLMRSIKIITENKLNLKCKVHDRVINNVCVQSTTENALLEPLCSQCMNKKDIDQSFLEFTSYPIDFCDEIQQEYQLLESEKVILADDKEIQMNFEKEIEQRFQDFYQISLQALEQLQQNILLLQQQLDISLSTFQTLTLKKGTNPKDLIIEKMQKISAATNFDELKKGLSEFKQISNNSLALFPLKTSKVQEFEIERFNQFSSTLSFDKEIKEISLNLEEFKKIQLNFNIPLQSLSSDEHYIEFDQDQSQLEFQEKNCDGFSNVTGIKILNCDLWSGVGYQNAKWFFFISKMDKPLEKTFQIDVGSVGHYFIRCIKKVSQDEIICGFQRKLFIINFQTQNIIQEFDTGDENNIMGIEIRNEKQIFIAQYGTNKILCIESKKNLQELNIVYALEGHSNHIRQIQLISGELFSCSDDGTLRVWDIQNKSNTILVKLTHAIFDFGYSEQKSQLFLIGNSQNLYQISKTSRELINNKILLVPQIAGEIPGVSCGYFMEIAKDGLFIGSYSQGLVYFDLRKQSFSPFENSYKGSGYCMSINLLEENSKQILLFVDDSLQRINKVALN